MPTSPTSANLKGQPQRPEAFLVAVLLLLALASALGTFLADSEWPRRSLALHASLAFLLLPLTLTALLFSHLPTKSAADWRITAGVLALCTLLTVLTTVLPANKTLLISFFPLVGGPYHAALLIGAPTLFIVALLTLGDGGGSPGRSSPLAGSRWLALPPAVSLLLLAWSWTATADVPPHIREEIAAWAGGHSWGFTLAGITLWSWLQLAGIDGVTRRRWLIAGALPALSLPVAMGFSGTDDPRFFGHLAWTQLILIGLAPTALVLTLLRDPIRRLAGGGWLWCSAATLIAAWLAAIGLSMAGTPNAARLGALTLQHGLGLALLVGLGAVLRLYRRPGNPVFPYKAAARLTVLGSVVGMVIALAVAPPDGGRKASKPIDDNTRRHVLMQRDKEIAERFAQGVEMMRRKEYAFAITAFHRVLELDPTLADAHVNMGFSLYETGDPAGAQRFFESATRLNRNQLNAYYGLALAASAQGQHEVAGGAMRTWLHLAPPDDPFRPRAEALFDQAIAARRTSEPEQRDSLPRYPTRLPR